MSSNSKYEYILFRLNLVGNIFLNLDICSYLYFIKHLADYKNIKIIIINQTNIM